MAIKIISLERGKVTNSTEVPILDATASGHPSVVVRAIRFASSAAGEVGLNVFHKGPPRYEGATSTTAVSRRLRPPGSKIPPGGLYIIDEELALEGGKDQIRLSVTGLGSGEQVDYVISGFTRDF